jgi:uncharacterized DUF497 family protein
LLKEWRALTYYRFLIKQVRTSHGVSFEEAKTVFYDENAMQFDDQDHSANEDRFIMIGISFKLRVLVVSHCKIEGDVIRIISARKAARHEVKYYEEERI